MSSAVAVVALSVGVVTVFAFLVGLPRQILRPVLRDKLLRLLDDIDWARRDAVVPANNPAVLFLREVIVEAVVERRINIVDLTYTATRATDLVGPVHAPTPWKLTAEERHHYDELRRRFSLLVPAYVFFGSWPGIFYSMTKMFTVTCGQVRVLVTRRLRGAAGTPAPFPDAMVDTAVIAIKQGQQFTLAA